MKYEFPQKSDYWFALKTKTLTEPPCKDCVFFHHETRPIDHDGDSTLCHGIMENDFRCYQPKA